MIIISDTQTRLAITVGSVFLGFILAITGLISGNEPLIRPDLRESKEIVWKNRISSEKLAEWILSGRRDFVMVGFRHGDSCLITDSKNRFFECYELNDIKNPFWLRQHFPNLKVPMVVYSGRGEMSLEVSALLQFYGYRVHLLEGGYQEFVRKFISPVEISDNISETEKTTQEKKTFALLVFFRKRPVYQRSKLWKYRFNASRQHYSR